MQSQLPLKEQLWYSHAQLITLLWNNFFINEKKKQIYWLGPESLKSILFLSMPIWEVFCKIYVRSPFQELHCNRATFDPKDFCNLFIFKWVVYPNYSINGRLQAGKVLKSTNELQN